MKNNTTHHSEIPFTRFMLNWTVALAIVSAAIFAAICMLNWLLH